MESMSWAPMIAGNVSKGELVEYSSPVSILHKDGLIDAYSGMRCISGETIAKEEGITREDADYQLAEVVF